MATPSISVSSVARRHIPEVGVSNRKISSTAVGIRSGLARSFACSSGFSISNTTPPAIALVDVSFPATSIC